MKRVILYESSFIASAKKIDGKLKEKLASKIEILEIEPFHPKLHSKPLTGPLKGFYSFRIGRNYRVIFIFAGNGEIQLIKIAKRDEIYKN